MREEKRRLLVAEKMRENVDAIAAFSKSEGRGIVWGEEVMVGGNPRFADIQATAAELKFW